MKKNVERLGLHEEVLLLALSDEKGTIIGGTWLSLSLGGAVLSEMLLREIAEVETEGKKSFLKLNRKKRTGDELLDLAIEKLKAAKRRATLETWVSRFSGIKEMRHVLARQLCKKNILRADEKQVLFFFKQRIYPERDHATEKEIIARLKDAIFSSGKDADARTIVLLSLVNSGDLLRFIFDRKKLKARKSHIENLVKGNTLGDATKSAIQSAQVAIMVATMVPVMASTAIHH